MEQSGADRRSLLKLAATALTGAAVSPRSGEGNKQIAAGTR
jgi:hypothetical protein